MTNDESGAVNEAGTRPESLVICPVYNEGGTIEPFYRELRRFYRGDCLFVDDGSTDGSREFLCELKDPRVFVFKQPSRGGYGRSLLTGFDFARARDYRRVVTIDTDFQHLPRDLPLFLDALAGHEVVLGSRYVMACDCLDIPRRRLIINRYISRLINLVFSTRVSDPFCGLRGYRGSFLQQARLEEDSYGLSLEIVIEVIRTKTHFTEVQIEAIYPDYSRKFLDGLNNPRQRLLHYLEVIEQKRRSMTDEEKTFDYQPPSG